MVTTSKKEKLILGVLTIGALVFVLLGVPKIYVVPPLRIVSANLANFLFENRWSMFTPIPGRRLVISTEALLYDADGREEKVVLFDARGPDGRIFVDPNNSRWLTFIMRLNGSRNAERRFARMADQLRSQVSFQPKRIVIRWERVMIPMLSEKFVPVSEFRSVKGDYEVMFERTYD